MTCREWLRNNGYDDVVALIDDVMKKMAARGSKQRRNWWDVLSGGADGKPCLCEGTEFPVLHVAQLRQRKAPTPSALRRREDEQPPDVVVTRRWPKKVAIKKRAHPVKIAVGYSDPQAKAS